MHEYLSIADLEAMSVELLPARETLALLNITAVNLAIAINAASLGSEASAHANQLVMLEQG